MKVGKLYQINKYFWFLYPSKDIADVKGNAIAEKEARMARLRADYRSKQLNCNVSFIPQNSMFVLLEQTDRFFKVLSTEGSMGWIIYPEYKRWAKDSFFEEVKTE
jgi:hypothetical protein